MKLSLSNISKTYKNGVKALDDVSIEIEAGMFGLLGPNGAGKSTLMRTIATLQAPDSGTAFLDDIDILNEPLRLRKVLGYLPQSFGVYPNMSAEDLLLYFAKLKGISNSIEQKSIVDAALEVTNLTDVRRKSVAGYSGGMKQRFGIAQLLLNDPKLIIVDEPTAGLDPAERVRFLNVLREIGTDHIVIFSTHIVDDVKELCNDMAIMNGGRILQHKTPREASTALKDKIWAKNIDRDELDSHEAAYNVISSSFNDDNSLNIRVHSEIKPDESFSAKDPALEDVYFVALHESETTIQAAE
ncbi:ABC transporter ATP-binding protein [Balneola sp. MJW-20]|uniref:ABC transporter ATP-binding protein n=1 Tax=Gracilimonas aurantiaca TaxID=3234185 RepID=UPI003465878B